MKQMSLIEMDGFLKGKCIPSDLKVNETNAEYLVRKFGELESKLETALRECRSAGITIDNLEAKCAALAAEREIVNADNAYLRDQIMCLARECDRITYTHTNKVTDAHQSEAEQDLANTFPASSAFLAEVLARGVEMLRDSISEIESGIEDTCDLHHYCTDFAAQLRQGGAV
ncbi:hypothetical protein DNN81_03140 [Escherichia coli]|uniref:hypothetical protein n=1 Tax=Escherichia coli TaxID=562 RepID=UPI0015947C84|nr:hypothetical protein [Escherichia coli]NVE41250.1 hypothetical protein [Escherichia coli]NVF26931.1 hypothetical protein [Escherichia coli]NVF32216.1 hypothetical protein [Escherichia coli]